MTPTRLPNIHPGEILLLDFLEPLNITPEKLSSDIDLPTLQIQAILDATRNIDADVALRLSKYFGNSAQFWLNLQNQYDLRQAQEHNCEIYEKIPAIQLK